MDEVDRIENEMRDIVKKMGYHLTLPEFVEMPRKDKRNYFNSAQDLLDTFKNVLENKIDQHLLNLFHSTPQI